MRSRKLLPVQAPSLCLSPPRRRLSHRGRRLQNQPDTLIMSEAVEFAQPKLSKPASLIEQMEAYGNGPGDAKREGWCKKKVQSPREAHTDCSNAHASWQPLTADRGAKEDVEDVFAREALLHFRRLSGASLLLGPLDPPCCPQFRHNRRWTTTTRRPRRTRSSGSPGT